MKNEALEYMSKFLKQFSLCNNELHLYKIKQSSKKPAYIVEAIFDDFKLGGCVLKNKGNEWVYNFDMSIIEHQRECDADSFLKEIERAKVAFREMTSYLEKTKKEGEKRSKREQKPNPKDIEKQRKFKRGL